MASLPSKNTKISLIGLAVLGFSALAAVAFNFDKWIVGGMAIKRATQTCNVIGAGCSSAYTSITQVLGSPMQILLSLAIAAFLFALVKAAFVIVSARRLAVRYGCNAADLLLLNEIVKDLGAEDIRIRVSNDRDISAFTYGVFRPAICLSKGLIEILSEDELVALVAHEIGHIRCRDNLAIFFASFIRDFLWPLPVSHHLFAIFLSEKEYAADDFAVRITGKPLELAGAIISVAKVIKNQRALSPAYATFFQDKATVKTRVDRLLGSDNKKRVSVLRLLTSLLISALMIVTVIGYAYAQPSVSGDMQGSCKMNENCAKQNYECCELK